MSVSKETAVTWWRGSVTALLVAAVCGIGGLVWSGVLDGRDSKPKIEAIDKRLESIEKATASTKETLVKIETTLNAAVILRIEGLERRVTSLEMARQRQDDVVSDVRSDLSGIKATLQEILRSSTAQPPRPR
jgi:hypothetical protein